MADVVMFRKRVLELMRQASPYDDGRRPTQADLASAIGLSRAELNKRLNGVQGKRLSEASTRALILALAEWGALISRNQADELLTLAGIAPFSAAQWQSPPLDQLEQPTQPTPASMPQPTSPHNLPNPLTSFVGRGAELRELRDLSKEHRLVTIIGAGGCGKSRLALEVARGLLGTYSAGCFLLELASLTDPRLMPQALAETLGVREVPGRQLLEQISAHLGDKHLLLVVDNCEHLIAEAARIIHYLLSHCSQLTVLATSRDALRLLGEAVFRVPSLRLPQAGVDIPLNQLGRYDAVRLFIQRSRAQQSDFRLSATSAPLVRAICERLDGIPLAIELAAALIGEMTLEQIAQGLSARFSLLAGGYRMAHPRHETLRASMDWSWGLLDEREQRLQRLVSVFAGSFSNAAAVALSAGDSADTEGEIQRLLTRLRDKGLVQEVETAGEVRYRLLETVREYAREKLAESGEDEETNLRHAQFYLGLAEMAAPEFERGQQRAWLNRLESEHDNLRAAISWATTHKQAELALRLTGSPWRFWYYHGHLTEGRRQLEAALLLEPPVPPGVRALALLGLGSLSWVQGDDSAARHPLREALALYREAGDRWGEARTLHALGTVGGGDSAKLEGRWCFEESIRIKRGLGDKWGVAHTLGNLANNLAVTGAREQARGLREEALSLRRQLGDLWGMAVALNDIGSSFKEEGNCAQARLHLEEALNIRRELDDTPGVANTLLELGEVELLEGCCVEARLCLEEGYRLYMKLQDSRGIAAALQLQGRLMLVSDAVDAVEPLFRTALQLSQEELADPAVMSAYLLGLAQLALATGDGRRAAALYGALSLITMRWLRLAPIYERERDEGIDRAKSLVGEHGFALYFRRGQALEYEQLTTYLLGEISILDVQVEEENGIDGNISCSTPSCPHCQASAAVIRAGTNRSGSPRYRCKACGNYFTTIPKLKGHPSTIHLHAKELYSTGYSIRQIARELEVSPTSVSAWIKEGR